MLIDQKLVIDILQKASIKVSGVLHLGAHECEEKDFYVKLGVSPESTYWIDAMPDKVDMAKARGIPNAFCAVITDKDNQDITFNISNNGQSSSVLQLKTHLQAHPWVHYVGEIKSKTLTLDSFFINNNIDASKLNFWNFDIQGAELLALKGAVKSLTHAEVLYLEVNIEELYEGCALMHEIDSFLETYNFKRVHTIMTKNGWGDAIYILNK